MCICLHPPGTTVHRERKVIFFQSYRHFEAFETVTITATSVTAAVIGLACALEN